MTNTNRKLLKYLSDVFISPTKTLVLLIHPTVILLTSGVVFIIAESIHCATHMNGAWHKYKDNKKTFKWMLGKNAMLMGRLLASLIAASALMAAVIFSTYALASILVPVYVAAFMVSSIFSTLHKVRGLLNHYLTMKTAGVTTEADNKKTRGLALRAVIDLICTVLTVAILLKVSAVMVILANPYTLVIGAVILVGMAVWKASRVYQHYRHPKASESNINTLEAKEVAGCADKSSMELNAESGEVLGSSAQPTVVDKPIQFGGNKFFGSNCSPVSAGPSDVANSWIPRTSRGR